MLGYEASFGYDPIARKIIRWAGHTQSGGHEQQNETWTYDPLTATFALIDTNLAPPGGCCVQQNVFDPVGNRFLRFRSFAGSHGWHWLPAREKATRVEPPPPCPPSSCPV